MPYDGPPPRPLGAAFPRLMKTYVANAENRERNWLLVVAGGLVGH